MPSFSIHISCVNRYFEKRNITPSPDFIRGVLDVDLSENKFKSHYSKTTDTSDLIAYLNGKVDIDRFLSKNDVSSDYDKGYFFHLLTDYYFYTSFFSEDFLTNLLYEDFKTIIYHDYESINKYLKDKYHVTYFDEIKKYDFTNNEEPIVLKFDLLDSFIDMISSIDIDDYIKSKTK